MVFLKIKQNKPVGFALEKYKKVKIIEILKKFIFLCFLIKGAVFYSFLRKELKILKMFSFLINF